MGQKQSYNIGFRGWMLLIYQFIAFFTFIVFTNYPMNILADLFGGAQKISTLYTLAALLGIIIQLIISRYIGKIKSIKNVGVVFGAITLVLALGIMNIPMSKPGLWQACFFLITLFSSMYATLFVGILVGQWFPRRKGTIMGIATISFPIGNGLLGYFAGNVFGKGRPDVLGAFIPFFIVCLIGLLIGIFFVSDYPEQVGAFRDNDKSMTPEAAMAMMEQEIEAKKTSVWTLRNTFKSRDFWFVTIPMGALLMCAVGMMTQSMAIVGSHPELPFGAVMAGVMVISSAGSWLLGVLDTKFGTKVAITISVIFMIISGVSGSFRSTPTILISLFTLAIFMGASSNFTVSSAAQYWRREDFSNVFSRVNPVANIIQSAGPMMVATLMAKSGGYKMAFTVTAVIGVVSLILILLFSPDNVNKTDNKYRTEAGKSVEEDIATNNA